MATALQKLILIAGPPGSGKSTMSRWMVEKFGFKHISAGDCLREEMCNENSPNRDLIRRYIEAGNVIPVEVTLSLLMKKISSFGWGREMVVIDGFPRNADNVKGFATTLTPKAELVHMITLNCQMEVCEDRILSRMSECERTDNASQAIRNRMRVFFDDTLPIVHSVMMAGKCTIIDANGTREEVWNNVSKLLTELGFRPLSQ